VTNVTWHIYDQFADGAELIDFPYDSLYHAVLVARGAGEPLIAVIHHPSTDEHIGLIRRAWADTWERVTE
jgi:hypothetical protein